MSEKKKQMFQILIVALLLSAATATCPEESYEWQNNCYFFENNTAEFADAESYCYSIGGHLASIHDGFTNTLLAQKGNHYFLQNDDTRDFWIGFTNMMTLQNWTWMDGSLTDFTEWQTGEPNTSDNANCASLSLNGGRWKTDDCLKTKPYVCKVDKSLFDRTTTPVQKCSGNFTYFQQTDSCYALFYPYWGGKTWSFGEQLCQSFGGHLTSIHSYEEMLFVLHIATPNAFADTYPWTGLYSPDQNEHWKWSDGSAVDYIRWSPANPIDDNSRSCVYLSSTGYQNYLCDLTSSIVCKIKAHN